MTTTIDNFLTEQQLTASAADLITTGTSEKKFISNFLATNTSTSNIECTFWLLDTGTSATSGSGGNYSVKVTIAAGKEKQIYGLIGQTLGSSQKIMGLAGTTSVVNIVASGSTET